MVLKINWTKSMTEGVGVEGDLLNRVAATLSCIAENLPIKYLGLPLRLIQRG